MSDLSKDEKTKAIEKCLREYSKAIEDIEKSCVEDIPSFLKLIGEKIIATQTIGQLHSIAAIPSKGFSKTLSDIGGQLVEIKKVGIDCNIDVRYTSSKVITITVSNNEK